MKNKSLLAAFLALLGFILLGAGLYAALPLIISFGWSDGSNSDYYSRLFEISFLCVIGAVVAFGAAFIVFRKAISQPPQAQDKPLYVNPTATPQQTGNSKSGEE